jgi:hypothetical protein
LNAAIALSILFLGPEIVRSWRGETSFTIRHPWIVAFVFGLVHGFGFASGLSAIGLPPGDIPPAVLMLNVGVEIGQLAFVALILLPVRAFKVIDMCWPRWVDMAFATSGGRSRRSGPATNHSGHHCDRGSIRCPARVCQRRRAGSRWCWASRRHGIRCCDPRHYYPGRRRGCSLASGLDKDRLACPRKLDRSERAAAAWLVAALGGPRNGRQIHGIS